MDCPRCAMSGIYLPAHSCPPAYPRDFARRMRDDKKLWPILSKNARASVHLALTDV